VIDIVKYLQKYPDDPAALMSKARVEEAIAEIERLRAELAAEREAWNKADLAEAKAVRERDFALAKVAKLREALEDAAIALDGWDDDMARRIRAALKETSDE
jgi:hypothetical protein